MKTKEAIILLAGANNNEPITSKLHLEMMLFLLDNVGVIDLYEDSLDLVVRP